MHRFGLAGPGAGEREREKKRETDTKTRQQGPTGFGSGRRKAGVRPDGEGWGAGKVEPWSSGLREEKRRLTA